MGHTIIKTPAGERLVLLPIAEFEAMQDAMDAAAIERGRRDIAEGRQATLNEAEVLEALAEPSLLAFWRKRRGLTQKALASRVGISQSYLAGLETRARGGTPFQYRRLALALGVRMEDLVEDDARETE